MRKRVYPRQIASEKMTAEEAASKIAIMREIADDYDKLAQKERLL